MHTTEIIVSVVDLWSLYHLWRFNSCCCYRFNELKLVPSSNSVLLVTCCPLHPLDTCCLQYSWYLLSSQFSWYWSSILSVKTCCLISPPDIFKFLSSPSFWYMFSSQFYWYWLSSPSSWLLVVFGSPGTCCPLCPLGYLLSSVLLALGVLSVLLVTCCLQYSWYVVFPVLLILVVFSTPGTCCLPSYLDTCYLLSSTSTGCSECSLRSLGIIVFKFYWLFAVLLLST